MIEHHQIQFNLKMLQLQFRAKTVSIFRAAEINNY